VLWWSGIGDLVAKITAVEDWRLAFHAVGTPVDDFAALLSDSTVMQFMARPQRDLEGTRLLATALMLNGVSMAVCGSSRPASGSEHLISHAVDAISERPRLHGLQVGVASYLVARIQERTDHGRIAELFDRTGFWSAIEADPFVRSELTVRAQQFDAYRLDPKKPMLTLRTLVRAIPELARLRMDLVGTENADDDTPTRIMKVRGRVPIDKEKRKLALYRNWQLDVEIPQRTTAELAPFVPEKLADRLPPEGDVKLKVKVRGTPARPRARPRPHARSAPATAARTPPARTRAPAASPRRRRRRARSPGSARTRRPPAAAAAGSRRSSSASC
jgi:hypothetical protein